MRRTYRSKKDCAGALDHREVIQALDEKTSIFDAFYIQNIKQTKRELSCIATSNNYGAVGSKVRKRKYVKRIVNEVQPPTSSRNNTSILSSHSVFLTPDKSIRVNKPQDLFDQLLNSQSPQLTVKTNYSQQVKTRKYQRKKSSKLKKYNCSSSDSYDSDKENSGNSNTTDLRSYELLIEKERKPGISYDDSINNIVKKFSMFNKEANNSIIRTSIITPVNHRLTENFPSSHNLSQSPLCSTPYKEKHRGQSIYKFSPIAICKNAENPKHLIDLEENSDKSIVVIENETVEPIIPASPILQLSIDRRKKSSKRSKTQSNTEESMEVCEKDRQLSNDLKNSDEKFNEYNSIGASYLETSEATPFLGFSEQMSNPKIEQEKSLLNSLCISTVNIVEADAQSILISRVSCDSENNITDEEQSSVLNVTDDSYNTCNSGGNELKILGTPVVQLERLSQSILLKYLKKNNDSESPVEFESSKTDSHIENEEYESFEDCADDVYSKHSSDIVLSNEHILNDVVDLENIETKISPNDTMASVDDLDSDSEKTEYDSVILDNKSLGAQSINHIDDDRIVSYVTTRRRKENYNDSVLLEFNDSFRSNDEIFDKTVLSNDKLDTGLDSNDLKSNLNENRCASSENSTCLIEHLKHTNTSQMEGIERNSLISRVTFRKNSRLHDDKNSADLSQSLDNNSEMIPTIVLQPGKKWERSLSIYRRITMMTDHFDSSILDDELLKTKGRKYRQSVINTMEMQENEGSIHNVSIISRRSTFVSKPCRSTISFIEEPNSSRHSLRTSVISEDLKGFLTEVCDDTVVELSKLSIADADHEVTVLENFHDTPRRVCTARDYVLRRCNQVDQIPFDECYPDSVLKNCHKIGEGVYGEVFLWRASDGRARVMKIVPIAGTTRVNGEYQKDFNEIISEIVIAMELSALRAPIDEIQNCFDEDRGLDTLDLHSVGNATDVFNEVIAVKCVYGTYPSRLLDLWELYDECNGSENDNPAILPADQQYIVLELANAGRDLESYEFNNAEQAHALFWQVAYGLAVGEEALQFEHRDLHWGNVLIAPTEQKFATFVVCGRARRVRRCGVRASIIDYSLSRAAPAGAPLYADLARDHALFAAAGDYQFHVYRLMRDALGNEWSKFEPHTNILWLHYTVDKMITALRYKRTNTKIHKHYIAKLKEIKNRILNYDSAKDFVLTDNEY